VGVDFVDERPQSAGTLATLRQLMHLAVAVLRLEDQRFGAEQRDKVAPDAVACGALLRSVRERKRLIQRIADDRELRI
jgi:hypothetical protein